MSQQPTEEEGNTSFVADQGKAPLLTIPEQNWRAMEIPESAVIPVARFAPPIPQAIPAQHPEGEAISLDIERRPGSKGVFSLFHPLRWHHWLIFWFGAGTFVTLAGLVLGAGSCVVGVILSLIGALVVKCFDENANRKSTIHVPLTPVAPSSAYKKCSFCAEAIRFEAKLCRFCQKEQPVGVAIPVEVPDAHLQQPKWIDGFFGGTTFDAVAGGVLWFLVCAPVGILLSVLGLILCQRLDAKKRAGVMLAIQLFCWITIVLVLLAFGVFTSRHSVAIGTHADSTVYTPGGETLRREKDAKITIETKEGVILKGVFLAKRTEREWIGYYELLSGEHGEVTVTGEGFNLLVEWKRGPLLQGK